MDYATTERAQELLDDTERLLAAHAQDCLANLCRNASLRVRGSDAGRYAEWMQGIVKTVDVHRVGGVRVQAQTPLCGRSLLTTLSTAVFDALLQRAVHPLHGVQAWRTARKSPLVLPKPLQGIVGELRLNALLAYVYAYHRAAGAADAVEIPELLAEHASDLPSLAAWAHANWATLAMPDDAQFECAAYVQVREWTVAYMPAGGQLEKFCWLANNDAQRCRVLQNDYLAYCHEFHEWAERGGDLASGVGEPQPSARFSQFFASHHRDLGSARNAVRVVHMSWASLGMPARCWLVRTVQPDALPGDVLLWGGFHGSAAVPRSEEGRPHGSVFIDYMPRDTLTANARRALYTLQQRRPVEFGAGLKQCRSEAYNHFYNSEQRYQGGMARLPPSEHTALAHYLAGDDAHAVPAPAPVLSDEQLRVFGEQGWLIVPAAQLDALSGGQWSAMCVQMRDELQHYLNWVLLDRQNMPEVDRLRFDRPDDRRWRALSGSCRDAAEHFGDKLWLRVRKADGTRCGTAQAGGALLAGDSGMGPATNLYDSPAQQRLRASPALYALFAQLYGRADLMAVPERARVKVSSKVFATHTDCLHPAADA